MSGNHHQQVTLRGTLLKIIFHNNENGFCIGLLRTDTESVTIVGSLFEPREGDSYSVTGRWTTHARYGRQFQFETYEVHEPTTVEGIEQYLASGLIHGIGPALASRIVKRFGRKTLDVLNDDAGRLLEVEGVGKKKLRQIVEAAGALREMQESLVFLKSFNVGTGNAIRIFRTYGKGAAGVVKNNPYQLILDVRGIGFQTADAIAQRVGVDRESPYRLEAGIRFVLDEACQSAGHCFLPHEELVRRAAELLSVDEAKIERAVEGGMHSGLLIAEEDRIFPFPLHEAEMESARKIERLLRKGTKRYSPEKLAFSLRHIERRHRIEFDTKQRDAILLAMRHPVTILTGGPGTGKTLCVNGIIELADELGLKYLLCAPTGRAAKRLSELTDRQAMTIHRLLEYDPLSGVFRRNSEAPLECNFLVVDEMSMVDIQLFAALLDALHPDSQLVLVGDVDQLPSVGPGQVLRDLLESNRIDTVRLDTIFRQSEQGSIIVNSHRINEGEFPHFTGDFQFLERKSQDDIQSTIVRLCSTILPQNNRYDPFDDIQVLSPMHNTLSGVKELNRVLQQTLNGQSRLCWQGSDRRFLMGDKVMQTKNNYDKDVYNGDIGRISGVDREEEILVVNFYGRRVEYPFDQLDELVLAYAMTVHKSQGNEFPAVIIPIATSHYMMLQRNLMYTAVTRAREILVLVGEKKALTIALRNAEVRERNTLLCHRIKTLA